MAGSIVVLHVDDDADFAVLTANALERADDRIEVHTEATAADGIAHLRDSDVDCVVSDFDMPSTNGLEFLGTVRDGHPDVPFVLFTGAGSRAVASEALSNGATDYVRKDGGREQFAILANRIVNYVERARLRTERRRFREAIECAREGIAIMDETGEFVYTNEACGDLYGYEPEELVGRDWTLLHPDTERDQVEQSVVSRLRAGSEWRGETVGRRADGSTFLEDHVVCRTEDGEFVCCVRDRTDANERERELERYETILETMGDAVFALDEQGLVTEINEAAMDLVGQDYDALVGTDSMAYFSEDDVAVFQQAVRDLCSDGEESVLTVEASLQRPDGTEIPVEVNLTLLAGEDDDYRGTVGVVRDVTERRERERELERYETLLELMPDTVVVTDIDGTIAEIYAFDGWSGYEYDEVVGEHVSRTMAADDVRRAETIVSDLVQSDDRSKATYEYHTETADGELIPFENHITLLPPNEDGRVPATMSVLRNISARKERERTLERQNERLEEFAGIVSHDLRNPLNVANARLELARCERDSDHLAAVARSHDRMARLIDDLLTLSRQSEPVTEREDLDLATVAEEAWRYVDTGTAVLQVDAEDTVYASEGRLKQLLENLLRNSVEHSASSPHSDAPDDSPPQGTGDVTIRIGDLPERPGFYVADDGPGIPPADRERVFDSGYTTAEEGTGFGLSIVAEVATAHGWEVAVTESERGGARFEISLEGN